MISAKRYQLTSLFLTSMNFISFFISFFFLWMLWLALLVLYWLTVQTGDIFNLLMILEKKVVSFSLFSIILAQEIMLRYFTAIFILKNFYYKSLLHFIKWFVFINWYIYMVFIFYFIYVVYHIDWFAYVELILCPTCLWCIILLICCCVICANIFRVLHLCSSEIIVCIILSFFLLLLFLLWFSFKVMLASQNEFDCIALFLSQFFRKVLGE